METSDKHGKLGSGMGKKFHGRSVELFPIINCDYASWYVRFKKIGDGEKIVTTEIKLSDEAMIALVGLHHEIDTLQKSGTLNQVIDAMIELDQEKTDP